jgi:calcineurin-like phosphoesterase
MDAESVIYKIKTRLPSRFRVSTGAPVADAVIFDLDTSSGKVTAVKRIKF